MRVEIIRPISPTIPLERYSYLPKQSPIDRGENNEYWQWTGIKLVFHRRPAAMFIKAAQN